MTAVPFVQSLATITALIALAALAGCAGSSQPTSPMASASPPPSPPPTAVAGTSPDSEPAFTELERRFDARLGVYAIPTASGATVEWRADERFAYASTFKALAAAALVDQVGIVGMAQTVTFSAGDLVTYSPVTEEFVDQGMTLSAIADAAVRFSDNTAGSLLLEALGGPNGFQKRLEEVGDDVTIASRTETALNEAVPGDDRDTSTPRALASTLREYSLGDTLNAEEKALLVGWLTGTTTGDNLVRASLPADWVVGDKSGAGGYGTRNDIAIVFPPGSAPVVIAVMSSRSEAAADYDDRLIAEASAVALASLGL